MVAFHRTDRDKAAGSDPACRIPPRGGVVAVAYIRSSCISSNYERFGLGQPLWPVKYPET